jgi:hypothetical protein
MPAAVFSGKFNGSTDWEIRKNERHLKAPAANASAAN